MKRLSAWLQTTPVAILTMVIGFIVLYLVLSFGFSYIGVASPRELAAQRLALTKTAEIVIGDANTQDLRTRIAHADATIVAYDQYLLPNIRASIPLDDVTQNNAFGEFVLHDTFDKEFETNWLSFGEGVIKQQEGRLHIYGDRNLRLVKSGYIPSHALIILKFTVVNGDFCNESVRFFTNTDAEVLVSFTTNSTRSSVALDWADSRQIVQTDGFPAPALAGKCPIIYIQVSPESTVFQFSGSNQAYEKLGSHWIDTRFEFGWKQPLALEEIAIIEQVHN